MSAIAQKAQSAFAAYFQLMQSAGVPELADMMWAPDATDPTKVVSTIQPALTGTIFQLPGIVVRSEKMVELAPGCNVWDGEIAIMVSSSIDDDQNETPANLDGTTLHGQRSRAVFQLLFDVAQDESNPVARALALPYLNRPADGLDNRAVKDFTCSVYTLLDDMGGWDERHVETTFLLAVTCSWGDPA